jgi:hypothetical protein
VADPRRQARHLQQAAQAFEGAGFVRRGQLRAGEADPAVVLDAGEGVVHRVRLAAMLSMSAALDGLGGEDARQEGEEALAAHPRVSHRCPPRAG